MKSTLTILFAFAFFFTATGQEYSTGLLFEDIDTNLVHYKVYPKTRSALPNSYSMAKYAPSVGSQGPYGSCTSWSSAYCAFTINQRIQKQDNSIPPFSPYSLHNRLLASYEEDPCSGNGAYISDALFLLQERGCPSIEVIQECKNEGYYSEYSSRLSNYEFLGVSVDQFKRSLYANHPIIIAVKTFADENRYRTAWQKNLDPSTGIWDGIIQSTDYQYGAHAMCIIGYDDTKSAFKVQNSWGTDWGKDGYFWIKYSDINKIIYQAYNLESDYSNTIDDSIEGVNTAKRENKSTKIIGDYWIAENEYEKTIYLALAVYKSGQLVSEGWWDVQPNKRRSIYIGDRDKNEIYFLAWNSEDDITWRSTSDDGKEICLVKEDSFTLKGEDACKYSISGSFDYFHKLNPSGDLDLTTSFTCSSCASSNTRGVSASHAPLIQNNIYPNDLVSGNKFWRNSYVLVDPYSGNIIHPQQYGNSAVEYTVYYVNEGNIIEFIGSTEELIKLNHLKFYSKLNAENFINSQ